MTMNDLIYVFFLCTHNSASLGLFPSAPARVHSNIDIDSDIDIDISVKMAAPWGSLNLLSFHSLCLHLRSHLTKWDIFQNMSS